MMTHKWEFKMKKVIRIIGTILAVVKLSTASELTEDPYLSNNILQSVQNISISKLLDFKKIARAIEDEFDKARFHYIISHEIDQRMKELDKKFDKREKKFQKAIISYENELGLSPYQYADERPYFDYVYQTADITINTIANDIHRIQAELSRTQFIQVYQYYRRRLDNYKNYLITLRELYKCKIIENKDDQIAYYSNFQDMYHGIKLLHRSMDDAGKMHVQRDVLGKVLYINWSLEGETDTTRRREFEYYEDGLLSKISDKINDEVVFEILYDENNMAENFLDYIFSPGFIPRDYNYYTEVYYKDEQPSAYKFTTMNGHVIGSIYREFDDKDHLIKEVWCKGETSKILREFSSIFEPSTGGYKLIERDRNGKIVNQEIVLSSND